MRTLRLSLTGTVILALLGGLAGVTVAQDAEDEPVAATHVTGTVTDTRDLGGGVFSMGDIVSMSGGRWELDIEWTDPRLPSPMRVVENWHFWPAELGTGINGAITIMGSVRLEGPDGAWTGTQYRLLEETTEPETYPETGITILEGEGAYEGLSAVLTASYEDPPAFGESTDWEGYILEGGMTPVPDLPEPPAE
jgi:hypothetical protein